jgi:protein-disulfide isomerase
VKRRLTIAGAFAVFSVIFLPCRTYAQEAAGKKLDLAAEIEALKEGQKAIRAQLAEIKSLLTPKAPPPPEVPVKDVQLDLKGAYVGGDPKATVFLIEFSDYQCPFCLQQANTVMPEVNRDFIKTGRIRYAFRNFPLEDLHPLALGAAQAAECAGVQGRFWEMHQLLFDNQKALTRPDLLKHAGTLKLDAAAFQSCLESGRFVEKIKQDRADGAKAGISGTPSLLIGTARPGDSAVTVTRLVVGSQPYPVLKGVLERALTPKPEPAPPK